MTKLQRVKDIVREYQKKSDKLFEEYQREERTARGKYSSEGFREEFEMKRWPHYSGIAKGNAECAIQDINCIYDEIKNDFHQWIMKPIKPDILQTLTLINQFNLPLSLTELKVIEQSLSDSYFGFRILSGLAKKAGFVMNSLDADTCVKEIESAKKNTENAIRMYAGQAPDFLGRDLLGEWTVNGISYGEYDSWHLIFAANFLHTDGIIDTLEDMLTSLKAPVEYTLAEEEIEKIRDKIDDIIDPYGGAVEKEKAEKLLQEIPDILSRLESIPEDFRNKKAAVDYFTLVSARPEQKAKENESKIAPAVQHAVEYLTNHGKADESILSQYK